MEPNDEEEEEAAAAAPEETEGPTMKEVELRVVRDNRNTVLSLLIRDDGRRNSIADIEISTAMDDVASLCQRPISKSQKGKKRSRSKPCGPFARESQ